MSWPASGFSRCVPGEMPLVPIEQEVQLLFLTNCVESIFITSRI